eukprot:SAG25_NODE_5819_length_618_cov_1.088632_1_plen_34_part_01
MNAGPFLLNVQLGFRPGLEPRLRLIRSAQSYGGS